MRFPSLGLSDRAATLGRSSSSGERLTKVGAIANHLVISIMYVFSVSSCPARHNFNNLQQDSPRFLRRRKHIGSKRGPQEEDPVA